MTRPPTQNAGTSRDEAPRWVVVGAGGMLGRDVVDVLRAGGEDVVALTRAELDIRDRHACRDAAALGDVLVNCAGWTAVDDAETAEAAAWEINALATSYLAAACADAGSRLVHVSTDYVFSGDDVEPYAEGALPSPRSAYGRTKAAGEWAALARCPDALVVRTAWLYGAHGQCFPRTIQRVLSERGTAAVVDDQHGQPTWTRDVAGIIQALVRTASPGGIQHATAAGRATWHDFARAVAEELGLDPAVVRPTSTEHFPRPAPRPASSVLAHDGLAAVGVRAIGDWRARWAEAAPSVLSAAAAG